MVKSSDREISAFSWFSSETSLTVKPEGKFHTSKMSEDTRWPRRARKRNRVLPVFFRKIASGLFVL